MAKTIISYLYDKETDANLTLQDLEAAGISHDAISIVTNRRDNSDNYGGIGQTAEEGAVEGAALGAILGAETGMLAGLGAITIPGLGPIVAAGWIAAMAAGATAGATAVGLLGLLIGAGMDKSEAHDCIEGIRRGKMLVSARIDDGRSRTVDEIMRRRSQSKQL